jgi:hypothetical protein
MEADPNTPVVLANLLTDAEAALLIGHLQTLGTRMSGPAAPGWPEAATRRSQADFERASGRQEHRMARPERGWRMFAADLSRDESTGANSVASEFRIER